VNNARELATTTASETGYLTIFNTWYGKIGQIVLPLLSQSNRRAMWDVYSKRFAIVHGRH